MIRDYPLIKVFHLQFVDKILVFVEKSWTNVRSIKDNLLLFELLPDLKGIFITLLVERICHILC